jgi:protein-tyrosine phosphatase
MLRELSLPSGIPGRIFLSGMPGRYRALDVDLEGIQLRSVDRVISLASLEEIRSKSPSYLSALQAESMPMPVETFAVPDYGVPSDVPAFFGLIKRIAESVAMGDRLVIHCGAGIGRTGTAAACVLLALGLDEGQALSNVRAAGSGPETSEQNLLVRRFADDKK